LFRFDITSTVAELEQILLLPVPPSSSQRESIDGCGFSKVVASGQTRSPSAKGVRSRVRGGTATGSPAKRKLFKSEGREQKHSGKGKVYRYVRTIINISHACNSWVHGMLDSIFPDYRLLFMYMYMYL
jgi:hypothetical protein